MACTQRIGTADFMAGSPQLAIHMNLRQMQFMLCRNATSVPPAVFTFMVSQRVGLIMGSQYGNIYVDVSEWFRSKSATGIQRVLHETIEGLKSTSVGLNVVPVVARGGKFYQLTAIEYFNLCGYFASNKVHSQTGPVRSRYHGLKSVLKGYRHLLPLVRVVRVVLILMYSRINQLLGNFPASVPIGVDCKDVLLLMDAFWTPHIDILSSVNWFKKKRGKLLFLVHDLIPLLRRPQTDYIEMFIFKRRLLALAALSNQNLIVSRDQLAKIADNLPSVDKEKFKVIYLGCDGPKIEEDDSRPFDKSSQRDVGLILMVGTLSERKNHNMVLDAFDKLYSSGRKDLRLVIAGDPGPATGRIRMIVNGHLPKPPYLTVLGKVSDETLVQLYKKASACIFASEDEGFGLPLWEAQRFKTPVIASDIPVFREIGNQNVTFFECGNSEHLAAKLDKHRYQFVNVSMRTWGHFSAELAFVIQTLCETRGRTSFNQIHH